MCERGEKEGRDRWRKKISMRMEEGVRGRQRGESSQRDDEGVPHEGARRVEGVKEGGWEEGDRKRSRRLAMRKCAREGQRGQKRERRIEPCSLPVNEKYSLPVM